MQFNVRQGNFRKNICSMVHRISLSCIILIEETRKLNSGLLYSRTLYSRTLYSRILYSRALYSRTLYSGTLYTRALHSRTLYSWILYSRTISSTSWDKNLLTLHSMRLHYKTLLFGN